MNFVIDGRKGILVMKLQQHLTLFTDFGKIHLAHKIGKADDGTTYVVKSVGLGLNGDYSNQRRICQNELDVSADYRHCLSHNSTFSCSTDVQIGTKRIVLRPTEICMQNSSCI